MSHSPRLVITEAFSPRHIGNWALVECVVKQLKKTLPDCRITILARDPEGIGRVTGEKTLGKIFPEMPHHASLPRQIRWLLPNSLWALAAIFGILIYGGSFEKCRSFIRKISYSEMRRRSLEAIFDADALVSIAGESINDHFYKKLPFVLFTYWLAARLGKTVILYPQSFGPLRSRLLRKITRYVLKECHLLMPRDVESERLLRELNIPSHKYQFVPDIALAQDQVNPHEARALLQEFGVEYGRGPIIAVVPATFGKNGKQHIERLAGALRRWLKTAPAGQLLVFIGNRRGGICQCNDEEVACRLVALIGEDSKVIPLLHFEFSPSQVKGIFAEMDLVISCRLHMTILSAMTGTPTIALDIQPKIREFMRLCDQENLVFGACTTDEQTLLEGITTAMASAAEIRKRLLCRRDWLESECKMASEYAAKAMADKSAAATPAQV